MLVSLALHHPQDRPSRTDIPNPDVGVKRLEIVRIYNHPQGNPFATCTAELGLIGCFGREKTGPETTTTNNSDVEAFGAKTKMGRRV